MSKSKNCRTCQFASAMTNECRRNPPKVYPMPTPDGQLSSVSFWPPVQLDKSWCGEYLPDIQLAH